MKGFAWKKMMGYDLSAMKPKFWITLVTCLAWCIDRELYNAIAYLGEQARVLVDSRKRKQTDSAQQRSTDEGQPVAG
jgi:hypothetical protein